MAKNDTNANEDNGAFFENNNEGLVVDLANVEAQKFEPLPRGSYNAMIEDAEYQLSKSSGKPMWNLKLAVTDEGFENRKLFTFLSWSEKALPQTKAALATFAPEMIETAIKVEDPETVASLVGKRVKVKVNIETYEGNENNRVKQWLVPEGADGFIA